LGLIFKVKIMLNIQEIREQFPILTQKVNDKPLVYLDNAASSQKPLTVIKKWEEYYQTFSDKLGFIKDLSVVDLLCNLGPEAGSYLKNHRNE